MKIIEGKIENIEKSRFPENVLSNAKSLSAPDAPYQGCLPTGRILAINNFSLRDANITEIHFGRDLHIHNLVVKSRLRREKSISAKILAVGDSP